MEAEVSNNKRIAKNTLLLYIRTIITLIVSLYTSRVILNALGVIDFGINNVVGGLVSMFSVISSSLCSSVSRYLTYELGTGNQRRLRTIFRTSVNIQLGIAILVLIIGAVLGSWFLNYHMSIPNDRLYAANWVLYCSLFSFVVNILNVPYTSSIISHEKMDAFAYITIAETVLKLLIAYVIMISPFDKLIAYTVLYFISTLVIYITYVVYCKLHFQECRYRFEVDKSLLKEMTQFAGWNFFGNSSYMLNTQGVNMLINIFFGVQINAARAIGVQVQGAILQFVNNFTTAVNPQITKSYASGDYDHLHKLICLGAKYSYFLLLIFTVPIYVEADTILKLWLKTVPDYSVIFLRLIILTSYVTILGNTSYTAVMATGKIKNYQLVITMVGCLVFPLTWILYKINFDVESTYYIYIVIYGILVLLRLHYLKILVKLPPMYFVKYVLFKVLYLTLPAFVIPFLFVYFCPSFSMRFLFTSIISIVSNLILIYYLGLSDNERVFLNNKLKNIKEKYVH